MSALPLAGITCRPRDTHLVQSFLECKKHHAHFYGNLDTKTLGGAGFASQRTTGDDREWDLSGHVGISIDIKSGDSKTAQTCVHIGAVRNASAANNSNLEKRYTLILKDELLPPDEVTGRERSTISWECDFELPPQTEPGETHDRFVFIPWNSFNPTYRGKLKKDADPLDTKSVKRISIMMRRYEQPSSHAGAFVPSSANVYSSASSGRRKATFPSPSGKSRRCQRSQRRAQSLPHSPTSPQSLRPSTSRSWRTDRVRLANPNPSTGLKRARLRFATPFWPRPPSSEHAY